MEFWDIPRCPTTLYMYVRVWKIVLNVLSQFSMLLPIETGISLQLDYRCKKCTGEKWKFLLDAKKNKVLQFFLEGELSLVTAHAKISPQSKVNCVFSEWASLLSNVSALNTRPELKNALSRPHACILLCWGYWMNHLKGVELRSMN